MCFIDVRVLEGLHGETYMHYLPGMFSRRFLGLRQDLS